MIVREPRSAGIPLPVLIPMGGKLEVHFILGSNGMPVDIPGVLRSLADAANAQFPFQYRLDARRELVYNHSDTLATSWVTASRQCRCSIGTSRFRRVQDQIIQDAA